MAHEAVLVYWGSRFETPGEVCWDCSDVNAGCWVPVWRCPAAQAYAEERHARNEPLTTASIQRPPINRLVVPHQPSSECARWHCFFHHVDEPAWEDHYYIACGECSHVYYTAEELEWVYQRTARISWEMLPGDSSIPEKWPPADEILFCPYCAHDF